MKTSFFSIAMAFLYGGAMSYLTACGSGYAGGNILIPKVTGNPKYQDLRVGEL